MRQIIIGFICSLGLAIPASAQTPQVSASSTVLAPSDAVNVTIVGTPGHHFALLWSSTGAGFNYAGVALAVGSDVVILTIGVLDGSGRAVVPVVPQGPPGPQGKIPSTVSGAYDLTNIDGFVARGGSTGGLLPWSGGGSRVLWYGRKSAFRAGRVSGTQWDDALIGADSVAFGTDTVASGLSSSAFGAAATASGAGSTAFGITITASGFASVAMGHNASTASQPGAFVFGDTSTPTAVVSASTANQVTFRASGGIRFFSNSTLTAGVALPPGGSAWTVWSDVNSKENFRDLDGEDVLTRLARIPIREWNYKSQYASIRHVGPTAQDFHAAFGLGEDPLRINTIPTESRCARFRRSKFGRGRRRMRTRPCGPTTSGCALSSPRSARWSRGCSECADVARPFVSPFTRVNQPGRADRRDRIRLTRQVTALKRLILLRAQSFCITSHAIVGGDNAPGGHVRAGGRSERPMEPDESAANRKREQPRSSR